MGGEDGSTLILPSGARPTGIPPPPGGGARSMPYARGRYVAYDPITDSAAPPQLPAQIATSPPQKRSPERRPSPIKLFTPNEVLPS